MNLNPVSYTHLDVYKRQFLGLCLGMQLSIVEFARDVIGWNDAHSVELDPATTHPVIHLMPDQDGIEAVSYTHLDVYKRQV